jgi:excisionase family DNA binding protein
MRMGSMNNNRNLKADELAMEDLLKPEDISAILKISRSFVYRLLKSGDLPSVCLGKTYRVRSQDLAEFIERNIKRNADSY